MKDVNSRSFHSFCDVHGNEERVPENGISGVEVRSIW